MPPNGWRRLGMLAVFILYCLNILFIAKDFGLFNGLGCDFLAFWSAGKIANLHGFGQAYNLELIRQAQVDVITSMQYSTIAFPTFPVALFPVFVLPFTLLSKLDAGAAFGLWSILNIVILIIYSIFFAKNILDQKKVQPFQKLLLLSVLISYPVVANLIYGQVETLLVICGGEMIRNAIAKKPWLSGAWLGGMLIKPQILLLVLPALLIMKNWKVLAGFSISSAGILLTSLLLAGWDGMTAMLKLWFAFVPGVETTSSFSMANWRMLIENLNTLTSSSTGWFVAGAGMLTTAILWLLLCLKAPVFGSREWIIRFLAIFAASCAFTWHSHIHMGMVLIPFLLYTVSTMNSPKIIPIIDFWTYAFPAATMLYSFIRFLMVAEVIPPYALTSEFVMGLCGLLIYMLIIIYGVKQRKKEAIAR